MRNEKKVIAIVVTYNRKQLLRKNLESLLSQNYSNCEVLVIDNSSTDKTYSYIKDLLNNKNIHYENTGKNIGGAGGFNYGIKKAFVYDCDYMWLMDDDCIVQDDSLKKLIEAAISVNNDFGFLSSKVVWVDGNQHLMNIPRITLSTKISSDKNNITKIKLGSFVSFLVKKDVVRNVGLPIADFYIWGDDWEYSDRISKKYNCYYVPASVVTHNTAYNKGAFIESDNINNLSKFNYLYRNEFVLAKNNGIYGISRYFCKVCYHILKVVVFSKDDKMLRINTIISSALKGITYNPEIEYIGDEDHE